ncbi:hypothetical protein FE257_006981 [Aspergillus nanangensis]|uniref:SH3 domain-containing protein n=1 Tax=Aspergillus nanangensis TaxID=2582783 RepID=A0AAD4GUH9_ASPNN|nr:hypothetical protein FE257_006981 [Aspergillus nanangensis]
MTRPGIVRADTIDLQDQHAPSAKDHSKNGHPSHGVGGLAPHQEQAVRHADQDTKAEMLHGPGANGKDMDSDDYHDGIDMYDDDDVDPDLGHSRRVGDLEEDDLADGESDDLLDDDMMDKISSSPSIDDEDIDFEFVYALHNFVATVDGQANAAKGDTMVLLDDSNSYWWLVRIVKDGSIGYLPAEHIETPTERLARLNKHRNVDLSATMLGDNSEKSKNPLKKAMRRRNAKTVTFTSPTYIEASDVEWSDDEDLDDTASYNDEDVSRVDMDDTDDQNDDIVVEPLRPKPQRDRGTEETGNLQDIQEVDPSSPDKQRSSQEIFEPEAENTVSRSRNGTVRNTDSFYRDDTVETKKISLTPNLLRDEIGGSNLLSDTNEGRGSLETLDKVMLTNDKIKDDKKRKDKKPGMLSGLFKRKDKKSKSIDDDGDEQEKISGELSRTSPTPKTSSESVSSPESRSSRSSGVSRQSSKLQKHAPSITSPTKLEFHREEEEAPMTAQKPDQSIRQVTANDDTAQPSSPMENQQNRAISSQPVHPSPTKRSQPPQGKPNDVVISPTGSTSERQDLSDRMAYLQHSVASPPQKFAPQPSTKYQNQLGSPVNSSPTEGQRSPRAPGLVMDLSSPREQSESPISPPLSPVVEINDRKGVGAPSSAFDMVPTEPPTWSDSSLRSYLDDENDIRDLFLIVHDKSNVPPAGPDHPITGSLFKDESKRLKEMNSQLNTMLGDWVTRKMRTSTSK